MSRIGKLPIPVPNGVTVTFSGKKIEVAGPKGKLHLDLPDKLRVIQKNNQLRVERLSEVKKVRSLHGLYQRLISNMVKGVTEGYTKELDIVGLGYRAALEGKRLVLNIGFIHPVFYQPPEGIQIEVPDPNHIVVRGIDKQLVGQVAADIRSFRPPEPYKGKGIRYTGEHVRRKVGKTGGK